MKLASWALTDTGQKRDHNEDSFLVAPEIGLFAVADGMGGHQGGEHASRLALEVFRREIEAAHGHFEEIAAAMTAGAGEAPQVDSDNLITEDWDPAFEPTGVFAPPVRPVAADAQAINTRPAALAVLEQAARRASAEVHREAQRNPELRGMGTTLTALLIDEGRAYTCHVGDSRGFLYRGTSIRQLTEDHTWIEEQVKLGLMTESEALESQFRHIITRSVGFEPDVVADAASLIVEAGDCFMLCSDGLSNYVEPEELGELAGKCWYRDLPGVLVDTANERGGDDNITIIVVYVANDTAQPNDQTTKRPNGQMGI